MHNLHFIVVKAETGEEACDIAENHIMDWGDENNWRTMCGAVSEDNETYDAKDGRYRPDERTDTIAKINKCVDGWIKKDGDYYASVVKQKLARGKKIENFNTSELYSLEKFAKFLYEVKSLKQVKAFRRKQGEKVSNKFNVLQEEFFAYFYDQCGVTQVEGENEGKTWVVFCDMHS